jgi:hypothetical protein
MREIVALKTAFVEQFSRSGDQTDRHSGRSQAGEKRAEDTAGALVRRVGEKAHDAKENDKPHGSPRSGSQPLPTCHTFFIRHVRSSLPARDYIFISRNGGAPVSLFTETAW